MPFDRNLETEQAVKQEIKLLQANCANTLQVIVNKPPEGPIVEPAELAEKINSYVKGLQVAAQNSNTPVPTDDNFLTSQFLTALKEKSAQLDELVAYRRATISDLDEEINRMKKLIDIANEVLSKLRVEEQEVTPEHILRAKDKFILMKTEIQNLIQSLFPQKHNAISELLGELMAANVSSNSYIQVTRENSQIVSLLRDINLVKHNPYDSTQVKLLN